MYRDPLATAAQWRAKAEASKLSIRDLIIEVTGRQSFVGSPATMAGQINDLVQADASDGFILVPHITPGGLDSSPTRSCRCCRNGACSGPSTRAPRCAITWAWNR